MVFGFRLGRQPDRSSYVKRTIATTIWHDICYKCPGWRKHYKANNPPDTKNTTSFISDKGKPEEIRGRKATGPYKQDSRAAEETRMHLGGIWLDKIARSPLFGTKKRVFYG